MDSEEVSDELVLGVLQEIEVKRNQQRRLRRSAIRQISRLDPPWKNKEENVPRKQE